MRIYARGALIGLVLLVQINLILHLKQAHNKGIMKTEPSSKPLPTEYAAFQALLRKVVKTEPKPASARAPCDKG